MSNYFTYARFQTMDDAEMLTDMLTRHSVKYRIEHEANQLDKIYLGESLDPLFVIKIQQKDFRGVNKLLSSQAEADIQHPQFHHYFRGYDQHELEEVIRNPNDWNAYDHRMAVLLLNRVTGGLSPVDMQIAFSYRPETLEFKWIMVGYALSCLTIFGVFFGLAITQAKKALPDGELVQIYDRQTIGHGKNMVVFGTITAAVVIFFKFIG
jgi:hypothetical protein